MQILLFAVFLDIFSHNPGEDGFPSLWLVPEPTQHDGWVFQHRSSGVILSYCTALLGSVAYKSFHIPRRNKIYPLLSFWSLKKSRLEAFAGKRWQATSTKCTRSSGWANTNTACEHMICICKISLLSSIPKMWFWLQDLYGVFSLWTHDLYL